MSWFQEILFKWFLNEKQLASWVRGLMKLAGGWLMSTGLSEAQVTTLEDGLVAVLPGLILFGVGQLFSALAKVKNN